MSDELDDDLDTLGDLHRLDRQVAAVDEESMPGNPGCDGELIHDPAWHAGRVDLGTSTQLGQPNRVARVAER